MKSVYLWQNVAARKKEAPANPKSRAQKRKFEDVSRQRWKPSTQNGKQTVPAIKITPAVFWFFFGCGRRGRDLPGHDEGLARHRRTSRITSPQHRFPRAGRNDMLIDEFFWKTAR